MDRKIVYDDEVYKITSVNMGNDYYFELNGQEMMCLDAYDINKLIEGLQELIKHIPD